MAQTFNFETRELVPYREDWNRGGNVKISGALWYIMEKDGLYLKIDEYKIVGKTRLTHDHCVAQGLPAAILAQGDQLVHPDFNFAACCEEYYKAIKKAFPTKPTFHIPMVLEEWELTLQQSFSIVHNTSGYVDAYAMMRVAVFLRDLSNPYRKKTFEEKVNHNYYYIYRHSSQQEPQFVFSRMPNVAERIVAPIILKCGLNQSNKPATIQTDGFAAAIINLAIFFHWEKRWSRYNFTDLKLIERINQACRKNEPFVDIADIRQLSFELPIEVEDLCRGYMDVFFPTMQKVWKLKPDVQLECVEGDNIYTYIYACEQTSIEEFLKSELYANLHIAQQRAIFAYAKRFSEWLTKTYPITTASQHRIMQAIGRDMPPIQLTIHNDIQVTHAGEEPKEEMSKKSSSKFQYIIVDDEKEILIIHKRIEVHLSSPAKLRDELRRLQEEGLVALPMENPTAIVRELQRIWGSKAPKEGSFKTTWGRVRC